MTESERDLLGPRAAEELAAGERWLADRLDSADRARPMPAGVSARMMQAVRREANRAQAQPSRRHEWRVAAAAALLVALAGGYTALMLSNRSIVPPADSVAAAQRNVDAYVRQVHTSMRAVDRVNASLSAADGTANQVQREITQLNQDVASAESADADTKNPWTSVADVIMAGR